MSAASAAFFRPSLATVSSTPAVLHIVDALNFGGVQTILKLLLEAQAGNRHIHLYALRATASDIVIAHPNVHIHRGSSRFSPLPLLELRRIVRDNDIRILHCHLFRAQVFGYLLARCPGMRALRLLFHEHGTAVAMESGRCFERLAYRVFHRHAAPRVERYIAISHFVEAALRTLVGNGPLRSVVLYNPVRPITTVTSAAETRAGWFVPADAFVVGMAGRIVARKGWRDFLAAVERLTSRQRVFFLIAGDGPEFPALQHEIGERGLAARGLALGRVADMAKFYAALDCLVVPSHWEPAGLTQLEAQAAGVAVVAYDLPGLNETVHDEVDCLLCRPGDATDLAAKIARLIAEPATRERLTQAGIENAARFSLARYIEDLNALYAPSATHPASGVSPTLTYRLR